MGDLLSIQPLALEEEAGGLKTAAIGRRVLMVTGAYYPEVSGAGLQCRSLIGAARGEGIEFRVITTCRDRSLPFRDQVDGVPVYRLPAGQGPWRTLRSWLPRLAWLARHELFRARVYHLHGISRKSWLFLLLGRLPGRRTLLKLTSLGEDDPRSLRRRSPAHYLFLRLAHRWLVPSRALEEACLEAGLPRRRVIFLPNGVDTFRFRIARREEKRCLRLALGLPAEGPLIIFTGHYSQDKRPQLAARAWSRLKTPAHLLLIGEDQPGAYEVSPEAVAAVETVAALPGLPGQLIRVRRTDRIEDYCRAGEVFILPSVREGLPNALLEAMACGLACVATRLPGSTDRLLGEEGQAGLLLPPDDEDALVAALERLCADPSLRSALGVAARRRIVAEYDLRCVALDYRQLVLRQ